MNVHTMYIDVFETLTTHNQGFIWGGRGPPSHNLAPLGNVVYIQRV